MTKFLISIMLTTAIVPVTGEVLESQSRRRLQPGSLETDVTFIAPAPTPPPFLQPPPNCVRCPPGKYGDPIEYVVGVASFNGYGSSSYSFPQCSDCPKGEFSEKFGASYCTPCPLGWGTDGTGSASRLQCKAPPDNLPSLQPSPSPTYNNPPFHPFSPPTVAPKPNGSPPTFRPTFTTQCGLGQHLISGSCQPCPVGFYGAVCGDSTFFSKDDKASSEYSSMQCMMKIGTGFDINFNYGDHVCYPCPRGFMTTMPGATDNLMCTQPICPRNMYFSPAAAEPEAKSASPVVIGLSVALALVLCGICGCGFYYFRSFNSLSKKPQGEEAVEMSHLELPFHPQHYERRQFFDSQQPPALSAMYAPHSEDKSIHRMSEEFRSSIDRNSIQHHQPPGHYSLSAPPLSQVAEESWERGITPVSAHIAPPPPMQQHVVHGSDPHQHPQRVVRIVSGGTHHSHGGHGSHVGGLPNRR